MGKTVALKNMVLLAGRALERIAPVVRSLPKAKKAKVILAGAGAIGTAGLTYLSMSDEELEQVDDKVFASMAEDLAARTVTGDGSLDSANALAAMIAAADPETRVQLIDAVKQAGGEADADAVSLLLEQVAAKTSSIMNTGDRVPSADVRQTDMDRYHAVRARIRMIKSVMATLRIYDAAKLAEIRDVMFMDHDEFTAAISEV